MIYIQEFGMLQKWKLANFNLQSYKPVVTTALTNKRRDFPKLTLGAAYQPKNVEKSDIEWNSFEYNQNTNLDCADNESRKEHFRMILPPPNVTGKLHLGHALTAVVQDVICRHKRQMGYIVDWIPGTDHAGIATQVVVEKKLQAEKQMNRHQIGRHEFLKHVWQWRQEKANGIKDDLIKLGCSLSWEKEYFTMDEHHKYAVNEAFIRLYRDDLIKRRESLVNWSCALESVISDIEVDLLDIKETTELNVPGYKRNIQFGRIFDIKYEIFENIPPSDSIDYRDHIENFITVSTTRPETMLGDVAVAVNPLDPRYMKYRQMPEVYLWHPFRREAIPLIFDVTVDPDFGSGAVKITPAHDRKDWEIAQRHGLNYIPVIGENGRITSNCGKYSGMLRFDAREEILNDLANLNLLADKRDHSLQLPICSRSKDIVEYMIRKQWFMNCKTMAERALSEVLSGRLQIVPNSFEVDWENWLQNCRDWCISRQLWWGHKIPIYKIEGIDDESIKQLNVENEESLWIASHSKEEALTIAKERFPMLNDIQLRRDPDVLDTWFSSALLPLSAFGWPNSNYKNHYPLNLMETGHDILFFWVARMVMLGLQLTNVAPFKKILLNGIIRDSYGRKMSKSLGNIITPQQVIKGASLESLQEEIRQSHQMGILTDSELTKSLNGQRRMFPQGIPECGADALRFTLCSNNIKNHFINFDINECYTNKLFLNKIWQATRFCLISAENLELTMRDIDCLDKVNLGKWDAWIMSRLGATLNICHESLTKSNNLHLATAALKQFFYSNLCDVYLETTKMNINKGNDEGYVHCATLATCLSCALRAISPFTPFISKELLQYLPVDISMNMNNYINTHLEEEIATVLEVCQSIRQLKSAHKITRKHAPRIHLYAHSEEALALLNDHLQQIQSLTLTDGVTISLSSNVKDEVHLFGKLMTTANHLCSFVVITNDQELNHAGVRVENINEQKLQKLQAEILRYRERLDNEGFRRSAKPQVQQQHEDKIKELQMAIDKIKALGA